MVYSGNIRLTARFGFGEKERTKTEGWGKAVFNWSVWLEEEVGMGWGDVEMR